VEREWYILGCPIKEKVGICDIGNEISNYVQGE
jgi:hypothetical protein